MKFHIQDNINPKNDIYWIADKPYQGLRNHDKQPMTKHEAFIFNDMLKYHAYTNIEPTKTYLITY